MHAMVSTQTAQKGSVYFLSIAMKLTNTFQELVQDLGWVSLAALLLQQAEQVHIALHLVVFVML